MLSLPFRSLELKLRAFLQKPLYHQYKPMAKTKIIFPLIKIKEAAAMPGCTPSKIRRGMRNGELRAYMISPPRGNYAIQINRLNEFQKDRGGEPLQYKLFKPSVQLAPSCSQVSSANEVIAKGINALCTSTSTPPHR